MTTKTWGCLFLTLLTITISCKKDVEVIKKEVSIIWTNPQDITTETPLSTTQLNATADVPGTFKYSPPAGTMLSEGIWSLIVDFTPADEINYNNATKVVTINVALNVSYGVVTDQDGNVYKTITLGKQTWMNENLRTTKYNDGTLIQCINDSADWSNLNTPGYCWWKDDSVKYSNSGAFYNWFTVNTGKLCPIGWHVPKNSEWEYYKDDYMLNYILSDSSVNVDRQARFPDGKFLSTTGVTNGYWWSKTEINVSLATGYFGSAHYAHGQWNFDFNQISFDKKHGYSVRCIKD